MSEERSKISLRSGPKRKGRPTISAPRQISEPIKDGMPLPRSGPRPSAAAGPPPGAAGGAQPRPRPRPPPTSGKTGDLVKRRYSTRFNNLPENFDATAPPPMPNFDPSRYEPSQSRQGRPP